MTHKRQMSAPWRVLAALAIVAVGAWAGKGGGKPGGGGGPPPDPRIAFTRYQGSWDLMVMNDDGTNVTAAVAAAGDGVPSQPSWSPDGEWIVFNGTAPGGSYPEGRGVYVVRPDGTGLRQVTSSDGVHRPVWSPVPVLATGESWILFTDSPDGLQSDLYVVNIAGTRRIQLTATSGVSEEFPAWSRDAKRIATAVADPAAGRRDVLVYALADDGAGGIEIANPEDPLNLTDIAGGPLQSSNLRPLFLDWARENDMLVVSVRDEAANQRDLWIIDVNDPAAAYNITETPDANARQASWSPDDTRIAYEASGTGRRSKIDGIYVMNVDGSGVIALVKGSDILSPDWRR